MMKSSPVLVRKTVKAREIPSAWDLALSDDPEAPVTGWISSATRASKRRPLAEFIAAGKGVYGSRAEAAVQIRKLRDEWST